MFPQEQPDRSGSRCPFRGWDFYFPTTEYSDLLPQVTLIRSYIQFFKECDVCRYRESLEDSVLIVFEELLGCKHPNAPKPTDIRDHPALIIPSLGLALYELESTKQVNFPHINLRLVGYEPLTKFRDLKSNMIGKFISLKGTVVRIGSVRPLVQKMAFLCTSCETTQVLTLSEGKYDVPRRCRGYQCRSRNFTPLHTSGDVQTIDSQIIKIQEILQSEGDDNGRIPRTLECELTSDLVGSCIPGDVVAVSGEVKVISSNEGKGKGKQNTFLIYLSVNAVEKTACIGEDGLADFTKADMYAISEIQEQPDVFRLIVHSLCPAIYGHELVKAGLVLSLFSSDQKYADDANKIAVRGDPHVLVVGDPGLGKSQLLRAVANVSPRGIYVCGNTASAAGLTVTLVREPGSSEYALEAGALVLADQGICCIDEFDKMGHEHESLLEAMELQSVSIAKAGIVSTLPARASLVAAANPAGGHYDKRKTVSENLKMSSALLSRFDLIFILLDKPNEQMDQLLSEHVMSLHRNKSSSYVARSKRPFQEGEIFPQVSLLRRFSLHDHEVVDHIPSSILRKYILYARNYCHPRLSREAQKEIQEYYLKLRQNCPPLGGAPITTRQLESLIRLAEARSRVELRETVTYQDARDIIEIMDHTLLNSCERELNYGFTCSPFPMAGTGPQKNKQKAKRFIAELSRQAKENLNSLFTLEQLKQTAGSLSLHLEGFEEFVGHLNQEGYLLKKGPHIYQLQTV